MALPKSINISNQLTTAQNLQVLRAYLVVRKNIHLLRDRPRLLLKSHEMLPCKTKCASLVCILLLVFLLLFFLQPYKIKQIHNLIIKDLSWIQKWWPLSFPISDHFKDVKIPFTMSGFRQKYERYIHSVPFSSSSCWWRAGLLGMLLLWRIK